MGLRLHVDLETNRGPTNKLYIRIDSWKVNMTVGEVKFTGEVLDNNKLAKYIIDMKRIIKKGETSVGLADGMLLIDDKKIYSTKNLKVGLF